MKSYREIMEQMRENTERRNKLEQENRDLRLDNPQDWKQNKDKYAQNEQEIQFLVLVGKVLMDNARRALYAELTPELGKLLRRYKGKPYGEKTKKKLSDEFEAMTGFRFYIMNRNYSYYQEIDFYGQGFSGQMEAYPKYDGKNYPVLLPENKIDPSVLKTYVLGNCGEYAEDPEERARQILHAMENAKTAYAELEKACSAYNRLIPSGLEHESPYSFKGYFR